jgi:hypothetical protein
VYLCRDLHSGDGPNFDLACRKNVESAGIMSRASRTATTAISTGSSETSAAFTACLPYTTTIIIIAHLGSQKSQTEGKFAIELGRFRSNRSHAQNFAATFSKIRS